MALSSGLLAHLKNPANRPYIVVLLQIGATPNGYAAVRLSTQAYYDGTNGLHWDDCLTNDIVIESGLSSNSAVGDCEAAGFVWPRTDLAYYDGEPVTVYIGDIRWLFNAFEVLAKPLVERVVPLTDNHWRIELTEAFPQLLTAMTSPLQGIVPTPIGFGAVRNASPVLIDPLTLTYSIGFNVPCTNVAVRDRGVDITAWSYVSSIPGASGTNIRLAAAPAGQITADFDTPGYQTLPQILQYALVYAGEYIPLPQLTASLQGFAAEWIKDDIRPSVWVDDPTKMSGQDLIEQILANNDLCMRRNTDGALEFVYLDYTNIAVMTPDLVLVPDDILDGSLKVLDTEPAYKTVTLDYVKNWTQMAGGDFAGSVSVSDRAKYGKEFLYSNAVATSAHESPLFSATLQKGVTLDSPAREQARLVAKHSKQRRVWAATVHGGLGLSLRVGAVVGVDDPLVPQPELGVAKFFVRRLEHNYGDLTTALELLEANA